MVHPLVLLDLISEIQDTISNAMVKLRIGDIVNSVSERKEMKVSRILYSLLVECEWFDNHGRRQQEVFDPESLEVLISKAS